MPLHTLSGPSTNGKFARFFYEIGKKRVSLPQSTPKVGLHSALVAHTAICEGPYMMDDRRKAEEQYFCF